jgi:hypothetical protein
LILSITNYRPTSSDFPLADAGRSLRKIPCPEVPHLLHLEKRLADFNGDGIYASLLTGAPGPTT